VLSYAIVAEYFPKDLAGRANAALNVFHIGGAFLLQDLTGAIIGYWPVEAAHHPLIAYQAAFGTDLILQIAAWIWFVWPPLAKQLSIRTASPSHKTIVERFQSIGSDDNRSETFAPRRHHRL
jgi:MFS family permease